MRCVTASRAGDAAGDVARGLEDLRGEIVSHSVLW